MENNKLTPKQRAKIYLKAANFFIKKKDIGYGCAGFCDFLNRLDKIYDCEKFAEYQLFKPRRFDLYWFLHTEEGKWQRVNALLLSYQMALDATE